MRIAVAYDKMNAKAAFICKFLRNLRCAKNVRSNYAGIRLEIRLTHNKTQCKENLKMAKEKQESSLTMKPQTQRKGVLQKLLAGLMMLTLAFAMMWLPMFTQTVNAEEQIKIELTYIYVNSAGDNSIYVDTQYVPAGTTWGSFFDNYQRCYSNGTLTDANAENQWEASIQNVTYQNETDCYLNEITNFNQYTDHALVTFYGFPSTYKHGGLSFEYYENEQCVDSGNGWDLLLPSAYAYGSAEALAYVERDKGIHSFIEEYCQKEGAVVSIEAPFEPFEGGWDIYNVKIVVSTTPASADSGNSADSGVSADSGNSNEGSGSANTTESTYTSDAGQAMRRIAADGNSTIAIDGATEYLPAGAKFASAQLTSGDTYNFVSQLVSQKISGATGFRVFEMNLTDASGAAVHQLNGFINVTLPIPEGLSASDGKRLVVYRIEDDGALTRCETATRDGYLTFATNHFSTYVIVEEAAVTSPKTGDRNIGFLWGVAVVICGMCFIVRRKNIL